jgi:hypothetical protein
MSNKKEILKLYESIDSEKVAVKMSEIMLQVVTAPEDEDMLRPFAKVLETMSKEEMAYIVCIHAHTTVPEAYERYPQLKYMIDMLNKLNKEKP